MQTANKIGYWVFGIGVVVFLIFFYSIGKEEQELAARLRVQATCRSLFTTEEPHLIRMSFNQYDSRGPDCAYRLLTHGWRQETSRVIHDGRGDVYGWREELTLTR